jgi:hypothetical protein
MSESTPTSRVFPKPKFGDIIKDYGFAEDANPQYRQTMEVLIVMTFLNMF